MPLQLHDVVRRLLSEPEAGWSMGSFDALAEFHHDPGEAALVDHPDGLTRATARGAIRINREYLGRALPVAYEIPSANPRRSKSRDRVVFPNTGCEAKRWSALTELGWTRTQSDRASAVGTLRHGARPGPSRLLHQDGRSRTAGKSTRSRWPLHIRADQSCNVGDFAQPSAPSLFSPIWGASRSSRRSAGRTPMAFHRLVLTRTCCRSFCVRVVPTRPIHRYPMASRRVRTSIRAIQSSVHSVRTGTLTPSCILRFKLSYRLSAPRIFSIRNID